MGGTCWSPDQPGFANQETNGLLLSGISLMPVSAAFDIIEPRKLLHHDKVQPRGRRAKTWTGLTGTRWNSEQNTARRMGTFIWQPYAPLAGSKRGNDIGTEVN